MDPVVPVAALPDVARLANNNRELAHTCALSQTNIMLAALIARRPFCCA